LISSFFGNLYVIIRSPGFYLTFWQMSTYDLSPPTTCYNDEIARFRDIKADVDHKIKDRTATEEQRRLRTRSLHMMDALVKEQKAHNDVRQFTEKRFKREKAHWFKKGMLNMFSGTR
jgi:THO complex subunit 2